MKNDVLVSVVLFLPLLGLIPIPFLPKARDQQVKWIALLFSALTFGAALILLSQFDPSQAGLQHEDFVPWISFGANFHIDYYVGVDGLSILLVLLTAFIMPLAILFSINHIKDRVRLYYAFMLILEFALTVVFVPQALFLFFIFWEISLVPMYFVIGIWGSEQRIYAAVKMF